MAVIYSYGNLQASGTAGSLATVDVRQSSAGDPRALTYAAIYRTQPNVRTVIDFLARNIAQVPIQAFRRVSDLDRERLADHELIGWLEKPNPGTTRYRLFESLMQDLGIYYNAYWLKLRRNDGKGIGLARIPPESITVNGWLLPTSFTWSLPDGREIELPREQVVYFNGYDPSDPLMGLSPLETLRQVLLEDAAQTSYRRAYWHNSARLEGVVERPATLKAWSAEQKQAFREQWQARFAGAGNAGQVAVLEDGMTFKPTSYSARDSEFIAARKLTREEVAAAYQVPLPMVGILDHATFCLPGDAEVLTEDGPRAIADIRAGDAVWSLTAADTWALQPVQRAGVTGYDQILTIRTSNRTLRVNAKHRVLVRRAVEVPAPVAVMHDGHRRAVGRATKVWQSVYVPAGELTCDDTIVTLRHLPTAGETVAPSGRVLTEGFLALAGLLIGDGNLSTHHGALTGVQFARADGAPYMDAYRGFMRAEFCQRGGRPVTLAEGYRQTRFASVQAATEMDLLGFGGTARTKRVPGWVFRLAEPLRLAFLRGYLDADGSVDKLGRCSFSSCSRALLSQIRHLCMSVNVPVTNLRCQRGETRLPTGARVAFEAYTFTASNPEANRRIGSHTPEYVRRMQAGQPFGRTQRRYPWHGGRGFEPGAVDLARIRAIETSAIAVPVYDLDVAETHNFVAEGVVVHNSNIKEQHKQLYQDCLAPWLTMITEELERQLLVDAVDQDRVYLEANIAEKLKGSFEESAAAIQAATGRPVMTANEGRARLNLPRITDDPSADALVLPLNTAATAATAPGETALGPTPDQISEPADALADVEDAA